MGDDSINTPKQPVERLTYAGAGVSIDAGAEVVERIRQSVASTYGDIKILGGLGGFAGMVELPAMSHPVLVSATDGVGTKVLIAEALGRYDTVGIDLVAMSVNDLLVTGARPLFFLDYLAVGKLEPEKAATLVEGVAAGCRQAGCALLGGETAEMPDLYTGGHFDLAGFAVGVVAKDKIIDGSHVAAGDSIIGLPADGVHSNGFSLVRKILTTSGISYADRVAGTGFGAVAETVTATTRLSVSEAAATAITDLSPGQAITAAATIGELLLTPTRIYANVVAALRGVADVRAMAHITGGGLPENLPRVIPAGLCARVERHRWQVPPLFDTLGKLGNVERDEMFRTFNMGIGFVAVVAAADETAALKAVPGAVKIGEITAGQNRIQLIG